MQHFEGFFRGNGLLLFQFNLLLLQSLREGDDVSVEVGDRVQDLGLNVRYYFY